MRSTILLLVCLVGVKKCYSFSVLSSHGKRTAPPTSLSAQNEDEAETRSLNYDELQPPAFNLRKESLLFDENASSRKNNNVNRAWKFCQRNLPYVFHGVNDPSGIEPISALYNMIFVRIPTIIAGLLYFYNLSTGHPLVVDFGDGAFEMNPLLIIAILYVLLL